jgi:hypothetical protein
VDYLNFDLSLTHTDFFRRFWEDFLQAFMLFQYKTAVSQHRGGGQGVEGKHQLPLALSVRNQGFKK